MQYRTKHGVRSLPVLSNHVASEHGGSGHGRTNLGLAYQQSEQRAQELESLQQDVAAKVQDRQRWEERCQQAEAHGAATVMAGLTAEWIERLREACGYNWLAMHERIWKIERQLWGVIVFFAVESGLMSIHFRTFGAFWRDIFFMCCSVGRTLTCPVYASWKRNVRRKKKPWAGLEDWKRNIMNAADTGICFE